MSNVTLVRRQNVLALFQAHAESAFAQGAAPKGLEQAFALRLQISPSMWSQIKSSRPIGDKLARQIEAITGRPSGWLDMACTPAAPAAAESAFVELALRAYRAENAAGRRALREHLQAIVRAPSATGAPNPPASANAPPTPVQTRGPRRSAG